MDALDSSKNRKSGRVKELYDRLENIMKRVPRSRQQAAKELLSMGTLSMDLKQAIAESGLTHYAIGKAAGVNAGMIARYLNGERDLRLETAGKIAEALGYRLAKRESAEPAKPAKKAAAKKKPKS